MKILITENQKSKLLLNLIKKGETEMAADLVGGIGHLINIVGREYINDIIIGQMGNLQISHRGGDVLLMYKGLPLIEKSPWGSALWVYDEHMKSVIWDDVLNEYYVGNRKSLIKELVSRFPELYRDKVTVYKDIGKYLEIDWFSLN